MAGFSYLPARFMMSSIVTGSDAASVMTVEIVPLVAAMVFVGIILFALH